MNQFSLALLSVPGPAAYALIALLVFSEAALFVGFILPGETAVFLGGVLAATGVISLPALLLIAVAAAILGDAVGYGLGRRYGPRIMKLGILRRHRVRLEAAQERLRERGGWAVFFGRFTAFLRAVMPGIAGMSRMPWRRFFVFNAAGGLLWGVGVALAGYAAGNSYQEAARWLGRMSTALLVAFVVVGLVLWHRHRSAKAKKPPGSPTIQGQKHEQSRAAEPDRTLAKTREDVVEGRLGGGAGVFDEPLIAEDSRSDERRQPEQKRHRAPAFVSHGLTVVRGKRLFLLRHKRSDVGAVSDIVTCRIRLEEIGRMHLDGSGYEADGTDRRDNELPVDGRLQYEGGAGKSGGLHTDGVDMNVVGMTVSAGRVVNRDGVGRLGLENCRQPASGGVRIDRRESPVGIAEVDDPLAAESRRGLVEFGESAPAQVIMPSG